MRFLLDSMRKDLRWRFADPTALIISICVPVIMGGLMALAFGGGDGPAPRARVLVVDKDDGFVSNFIQGAGSGGEFNAFLDLENVGLEEGRERINRGDASALVIIPEGFSEAMLNEEATELIVVRNPAQLILPDIVENGLEMLVEATFYLHRVLGEPIRAIAAGPTDGSNFFADIRMAALSVQINQRIRALEPVLFPPVLEVETEVIRPQGEGDRPTGSFGLIMLPGILFMALLFIVQGMSEDLWREKEQGTLRRVLVAPQSPFSFLGGKVLAGGILMMGISVAGLLFGVFTFDLPWSGLPLATVWLGFSGTVMLCYFLFLQSLAGSQRGGNIITMMVLFPLMMIGGSFFPFESMPPWMASVGQWTPNGLAVSELKNIQLGSWSAATLASSMLAIGIPALLTFAFTAGRLRGAFLAK